MQKLIDPQEIEKHLQEELFDYFSNGSLIVDSDFNIVYRKGTVPYLNFSDGVMTLNLFDNLDKNMQSQMRALVKRVLDSNMREVSKFIQLEPKDEEKFVKITAQPFSLASHNLMILINFQEIEAKELFFGGAAITQAKEEIKNISDALALSKQKKALMKEELQESNEKLQTTVEELRTSNEELRSINEELLASLDSNAELQTKYEQTFKTAQIGIAHVTLDGTFMDVNAYLCDLVGYSKEELLKLRFQDITYAEDLTLDLEYVKKLLDNKLNTYHMEKRYIRKNGAIVWIHLSVVLLRDTLNKPFYFISIIQDISQIKMLILELESKKNEFENVIRFAPNPIMLYDEDEKILMVNKTFEELTGYTLEELPSVEIWNQKSLGGKNITNTLDIEEFFKKSVREDMGIKKVTTKSGKELTWVCSLSPLGSVQNAKRILIASAMDITEIQEKEELMLAQSRQAAMGDMIGMIAHQWRQPLSVISMVGNNLRVTLDLDGKISSEEIYQLADLLNEQTQYLSHTIDDFRTFFKPEKSKEKVVLCKVYEKLESMVRKLLENNQITLNFSGDCNMEFYTYKNELVQVLLNLLNNAKDVMKERNIKDAKVDIATSFTDDLLTINISDNGGGIDKSVMGKLGEPYVTTKNENGTGLGIYMSLMILKKHFDGTMRWKNIDDGCCFTITLPRKKSEGAV
ncbi:MAG: PAS domain S-box protein [Campylobacterales bacterium]|nr:PAS domain S-box protein [Campylobacterales bacterium]